LIAVLSSKKEHIAAAGFGMLGYMKNWPLHNLPVNERIASAIFLLEGLSNLAALICSAPEAGADYPVMKGLYPAY
jgi:hypothetical protein